jgi:hypothetical protein
VDQENLQVARQAINREQAGAFFPGLAGLPLQLMSSRRFIKWMAGVFQHAYRLITD